MIYRWIDGQIWVDMDRYRGRLWIYGQIDMDKQMIDMGRYGQIQG